MSHPGDNKYPRQAQAATVPAPEATVPAPEAMILNGPSGRDARPVRAAAPLALVAREAGGAASTGKEDVLAVKPEGLHQRVPLYIGSKPDVAEAVRLLNG